LKILGFYYFSGGSTNNVSLTAVCFLPSVVLSSDVVSLLFVCKTVTIFICSKYTAIDILFEAFTITFVYLKNFWLICLRSFWRYSLIAGFYGILADYFAGFSAVMGVRAGFLVGV
jgi:hypothetical protein